MNKDQTIKKIKELYLVESVKLHRDEEIIALYDEIIKIATEADLEAYKLCFEGHKALIQYMYDEAKKNLDEAIKLDDQIPYLWYCLGNVHSDKKNYDKAIECYEKAKKIDNNFAFPLIGLGNAYRRKEEYVKAIDYFNKAIELDDTLFYPWYNLGFVYMEKREYDIALEKFKQAEKLDNNNTFILYYIGLNYKELEEYDKSIDYFIKAKNIDNVNDEKYEVQRDTELIDIIKNLKENLESVEKLARQDNIIGKILEKTKPIFKYSEHKKIEFLDFLKEDKNSPDDSEYYLEVLRRWNSYTPIVADDYHISKGGGYFIKAGCCGIVIDPGFNFIDNFKGTGHTFSEIDVVIISHAHNDHTADLESILTLLYKYNEDIKNSKDPAVNSIYNELMEKRFMSRGGNNNTEKVIKKITDKEIDVKFNKSSRRKIIDIFMPQSVFKKYGGLFDLFERTDYRQHIIEKGRTNIELRRGCPIKMDVLPAKHHDIISDNSSVGMVLYTDEKSAIVYTGDTGWSDDIENEYIKISEKIKNKRKSVLIAHLGGFKEHENKYAKYFLENKFSDIKNSYYENHLGRIGVAKIAEIVKPELCLISEFGEEFKGCRQEIAEIYDKAFTDSGQKIKFLPADIGLVYHLEDSTNDKKNKIKVIAKIDIDNYKTPLSEDNYEFVDKDKIETILLREDYSLHYYAKGIVKPEELIQILQKEYRDSIK